MKIIIIIIIIIIMIIIILGINDIDCRMVFVSVL